MALCNRSRGRWITLIVALAVTACHGGESAVQVRAELESIGPIAQLEVAAVPFNPQRILDSLAAVAPTPKPSFPELEDTLAQYRRADLVRFAEVSGPWRALRDTVERLADSLNQMDRRLPSYASLYARFRRMYGRLAQLAGDRDARWQQLSGDEFQLARSAQRAADSLRAWEREAYAPYTELAAQASIREQRATRDVTTDSSGTATLTLEPGSWWILARWPDPDNPFQEYAWNVAIQVTGWLPLRVPLMLGNTNRRWRH